MSKSKHRTMLSPLFEQLEPRLLLDSGTLEAYQWFPNHSIPDNGGTANKAVWSVDLSGAPSDAQITAVDIEYWINHTYVGDLKVWLTAYYDGQWHDHYLWNREGGNADDIHEKEIGLDTWNGASPNQTWYLCAADFSPYDEGEIDAWKIWVHWRTPEVTSAIWTSDGNPTSQVYEGTTVTLRIHAFGYDGQTLTATIKEEDDYNPDDTIDTVPIYVSGGVGTATWTATRQDDGWSPDNRYYYVVEGYRSSSLDVLEAPDTTPPTNPTSIWSSSHTIGVWNQDRTIDVSWSGASDNRGLAGYYYTWSASAFTNVTTGDSYRSDSDGSGSETSPSLHDGDYWYFHIRYVDESGNLASSTKHYGPFYIDNTAPQIPNLISPVDDVIVYGGRQSFDWEGGDGTSGISQYELLVESDTLGVDTEIRFDFRILYDRF